MFRMICLIWLYLNIIWLCLEVKLHAYLLLKIVWFCTIHIVQIHTKLSPHMYGSLLRDKERLWHFFITLFSCNISQFRLFFFFNSEKKKSLQEIHLELWNINSQLLAKSQKREIKSCSFLFLYFCFVAKTKTNM